MEVRITIDDERAREVLGPVFSAYLRQIIGDVYILERRFLAFQNTVMSRLETAEMLIGNRIERLDSSEENYRSATKALLAQIDELKEITGGVSVIKNILGGIKEVQSARTKERGEERRNYAALKAEIADLKFEVTRALSSRGLEPRTFSIPAAPAYFRRPIL